MFTLPPVFAEDVARIPSIAQVVAKPLSEPCLRYLRTRLLIWSFTEPCTCWPWFLDLEVEIASTFLKASPSLYSLVCRDD